MASRNRNNVKIETAIENCRGEGKWQRVIELSEELKTGSPNNGKRHSYLLLSSLFNQLMLNLNVHKY